ncbi:MAG TPA: glycoside hydrolase family 36 protein [Terriglobia bacterium]|nr:glycoside hydrolase family 36 protein [Terriglobia bacterium]
MLTKSSKLLVVCVAVWLVSAAGPSRSRTARVDGKDIRIEFNNNLESRVVAKFGGKDIALGDFAPSETVTVAGNEIRDFALQNVKRGRIKDDLGAGQRVTLTGTAPSLKKTVAVTTYADFPQMAIFEVQYTNTGNSNLTVDGWTNQSYSISAEQGSGDPAFWSYQSGSYEKRPDWVLPLETGFKQQNYLGMNATDYGGGTPVVDVWRRDVGIAVGHLELSPKLVSLPVAMPDQQHATVAVNYQVNKQLKPGESIKTFKTFVAVHQGDYFRSLRGYRGAMLKEGVQFKPSPDDAFGPIWCAWGFGRNFTPSQVYNALPVVKKLGFRWVTLDDGWQTAEGDWFLNPKKFPNGDRDMKALVDRIHAEGFKAQLWWAPLSVSPDTKLITQHPEELLLNADGSKHKISYWNAWYLCPADPAVVAYHEALVRKILVDWGFDGLKLDGQFMNGAPQCYNPAHRHASPEASVEAMPQFFKAIYDTALSVKPDALVEFCPCGTAYSFYTMPFMNMSVASDPRSSWQVRLKGKTLKALMGDSVAYFGDHVDMSDGGDDFASTVGVGGVVGTNFTWPVGSGPVRRRGRRTLDLTPAKEQIWDKWIKIYKAEMLPKGEYLGELYDIGFDKPEAHAIRKDGNMYYAFYAPQWSGKLQLRGLAKRSYRLINYETGETLGTVRGPVATWPAQFEKHLMLEAKAE